MNKEMFPQIRVTKKLDLMRLALLLDMLCKGNTKTSSADLISMIRRNVEASGLTWEMILGIGAGNASNDQIQPVRESLRAVESNPAEWWKQVQKTKSGIPWDSWIKTLYVARYKEYVASVRHVYLKTEKLSAGQIITLHGILKRAGLAR
jgi:hypothetical protein